MNITPSSSPEDVTTGGARKSLYARWFKRPLDIAIVLSALPVLAPTFAGISLAIIASGSGPIFLSVPRKGRNGVIFNQWRFRCIRMSALGRDQHRPAEPTADGRDPRLTAVGDFLLRTRLNALPQLWNVLTGDMSLIGPLPEPVRVDRQIQRNATLRRVAPGIFCPSELPAYRLLSGKDRKAVAIAYATRVTFAMDVKVALNALRSMLRGSEQA